ncbi:MAG TPA: uracil-DNA glycosylase [Nitriliruptorales bacterium]
MADHTSLELGIDPFSIHEGERRTWRQLERDASGCTSCRLHEGRTNVVFGSGDVEAELMIVGAAPSTHDDLLGRSYVGGAGNLLTNALGDAGIDREATYVTTFVKCHPPGSRAPQPDEVEACGGYLLEQLAWVQPRVVVSLGELAMRLFVRRPYPLGKIAGVRFELYGATFIPTYDPGDALRGDNQALEGLRRDLATAAAVLSGRLPPPTRAEVGAS